MVTLNSTCHEDVTVELSSSVPTAAQVEPTVLVKSGQKTARFKVTLKDVSAQVPVIISGTYNGTLETILTVIPKSVLLTVQVPGKPDATYTLAQLQALSKRTVPARGHDGEEHSYTGVNLGDLLGAAGMPRGMDLKGKYLHNYVLATAADKYSVVFALPELDPGYTDKTVLVVWARDGQPLADDQGPLAIVAPEDKHPARWVRQLLRIAVKDAE
jgi:hypothetical protein